MNEKIYVPPIKIQGIKTKLVPVIKKNVAVSENTLWIEPFMGSGVVGFNVKPRKAIFSDINPYIIDFYTNLKENTESSFRKKMKNTIMKSGRGSIMNIILWIFFF